MAEALTLYVLPVELAVCRLPAGEAIPAWALRGEFFSVTRAPGELSVVCPQQNAPPDARAERSWRAFQVAGPLDFSLVGVLSGLAACLAGAGVSLFALSTYDTDYVLVRAHDLVRAVSALRAGGYRVETENQTSVSI